MRDARRPILTAALIAANVAALGLNGWILHRHGKLYPGYAVELAEGMWKYGPVELLLRDDPPIPAVSLKATKGGER